MCPHISQSLAVDYTPECEYNFVHNCSVWPRVTTSKGHGRESSEEGIWAEYHTIHMCNDEDDYDDVDDDYQKNS